MGGTICKQCDQEGLNFQNIQTAQLKHGKEETSLVAQLQAVLPMQGPWV